MQSYLFVEVASISCLRGESRYEVLGVTRSRDGRGGCKFIRHVSPKNTRWKRQAVKKSAEGFDNVVDKEDFFWLNTHCAEKTLVAPRHLGWTKIRPIVGT